MNTFPKVGKKNLGYEPAEVDAFIELARDQYSRPESKVINWKTLVSTGFQLVKDGYDPSSVDKAIEKLEDTFAERDAKAPAFQFPIVNKTEELIKLRNLLAARTTRTKGKKFERVGVLGLGYSRRAVDSVLALVGEYLEDQESLDLNELRGLKFKVVRGGYVESQVDAYIDRLVELMQTQRFTVRPLDPNSFSSVPREPSVPSITGFSNESGDKSTSPPFGDIQ
jgi:DivIVA domain-containing protein